MLLEIRLNKISL